MKEPVVKKFIIEFAMSVLLFDDVLEIVLSQYRISSSFNSKDYEIVIRFLTHTIGHFSANDLDKHLKLLHEKSDDLELFLIVTFEIALLMEKASLTLSTESISIIKNQIEINFWKIENRYSNFQLKHHLDYFSQLKKRVLSNLNEI